MASPHIHKSNIHADTYIYTLHVVYVDILFAMFAAITTHFSSDECLLCVMRTLLTGHIWICVYDRQANSSNSQQQWQQQQHAAATTVNNKKDRIFWYRGERTFAVCSYIFICGTTHVKMCTYVLLARADVHRSYHKTTLIDYPSSYTLNIGCHWSKTNTFIVVIFGF